MNDSLTILHTNVQEHLTWRHYSPKDKEMVRSISIYEIIEYREAEKINTNLEGDRLDLREYKKLWRVNIDGECLISPLIELDVSDCVDLEMLQVSNNGIIAVNLFGCNKLRVLDLANNNLTSLDFLSQLPNPEKLEKLDVSDNNILSTDIKIFDKFINLKSLRIGTTEWGLENNKHNNFYGSLKSWENLNKLEDVGIETTDINIGLEHLPESLSDKISTEITRKERYYRISCSSHGIDAKCKELWEQLSPYNFDVKFWKVKNN